jgi:hypothetical protein
MADIPDFPGFEDETPIEEPPRRVRLREAKPQDAATALLIDQKGSITACEHNALMLMRKSPKFESIFFDTFLHRIRFEGRDLTDSDLIDAQIWLQSQHRQPRFARSHASAALTMLANSRKRDSLIEYMESLKYSGLTSIDEAFIKGWGCDDTLLNRKASRNFFIALAARAYEPGAQVDTIWVFEGPQGSSKSQALRALGRSFHAEISAQIGSTDFMRELRGIWIAELAEMDSLRGKEASTIKRLLSVPNDRFVEKFEKYAETYPRRAVAVATTNETNAYWQDSTGARRLIPVKTGTIDVDFIKLCADQWLAEAGELYAQDATWWEWPSDIKAAQEERQQQDPWEDIIRDSIINGRKNGTAYPDKWPEPFISSSKLAEEWLRLDASQQGPAMSKRVGAVMRKLGFEPRRSAKTRGWHWAGPQSLDVTFRGVSPEPEPEPDVN